MGAYVYIHCIYPLQSNQPQIQIIGIIIVERDNENHIKDQNDDDSYNTDGIYDDKELWGYKDSDKANCYSDDDNDDHTQCTHCDECDNDPSIIRNDYDCKCYISDDSYSTDDSQESYTTDDSQESYTSSNDSLSDNDSGYKLCDTDSGYKSSDDDESKSCDADSGYKSSDNDDDNYNDESDVSVDSITSAIVAVTTTTAYKFNKYYMGYISPDKSLEEGLYVSSDKSSEEGVYISSDKSSEEGKKMKKNYLNATIVDINLTTAGIQECGVNLRVQSPMKYHVVLNHMTIMAVARTIYNYVIVMIVAVIVMQRIDTMNINVYTQWKI